jgi:hypothetical protein
MKRLLSKPCPFCGTPIIGKKRTDRNAYHYSPRCPDCTRKALTPDVVATRRRVLNEVRTQLPVGSKKLHKSSEGFVYVMIKTEEPNKWEYEHRVCTNAKTGEQVHHINGNTTDNRLENLMVVSPQEHKNQHSLRQWAKNFTHCSDCATTTKRHLAHGLCTTCYQRKKAIRLA